MHSFRDTELKLCSYVKDSIGPVVEGLAIFGPIGELAIKG